MTARVGSVEGVRRPFYLAVGHEESVFKAAYAQQLGVLLKGPTGVGKTRFVEAMAYDLGVELITVACHDDLSAADLVGRFLLRGDSTEWCDGPLTCAVRLGAICYLDEVVEARQDTTVVPHPLLDHRRLLPIDRLNVTLQAPPEFMLVVSYNPGYQSVIKDLKPSTRQRMAGLELTFPPPSVECEVIVGETGIDSGLATGLVSVAAAIRRTEGELREVASTRTLVSAARLIAAGMPAVEAAWSTIGVVLTDDPVVSEGIRTVIETMLIP